MKKLILFLVIIICSSVPPCIAQGTPEQQQTQAPKPKVIIQTPFGPKEVDADSPEAGAAAPAQAPAAQPTPAPAQAPTAAAAPPAVPPPAGATPLQPQQPPAAPSQQTGDEPANIGLQLDNADIYGVIRIIGDELKLNYVIDPAVKGTVNVNTTETLRRSDLLPILETILKINGATMIKIGNFYQIVPANTAVRQPLPVEERRTAAAPDDQMVTQIVRMKYVAAREMSAILTPYLSESGNLVVHDGGNILLITERRSGLRKLLEVIDVFDTNAFEGERVRLFPVKNATARDLIPDLQKIFAGYALSANATAIRFVAMDRINSVLVVTPNRAVFPEVEKWVERLDQPLGMATPDIRNFVYKVRNAKALDIQSVLSQLYAGQAPLAPTPTAGPAPFPQPAFPTPPAAEAPSGQPAAGVPAALPRSNIKIIADSVNNALVVQATPQDYQQIERTIQQLDILPRQVLIDAQIYEVVLDDSLSLGLFAILQNRGTLTKPQTTGSFAAGSGGPPSLSAQTFAFLGRARELVAFLNASENRSRVRTLSAPSVVVSDNLTADFQVGAEVPVPTSSSVTPVQAAGTNLFAQTIQFRPTGVLLKVKPQINDSGNVRLDIAQEVSQATANTTSDIVAPVIGKSTVTSSVVVRDGETLALGGFIRENQEVATSRIPLLGRIPIAGILFGSTRRVSGRTELIVLITPHVIRSFEEADLATEELKNKLKEVKKLLN